MVVDCDTPVMATTLVTTNVTTNIVSMGKYDRIATVESLKRPLH